MLNPFACKINGELSRSDVVTLVHACRDKRVVEFGVGASTMLISQCAKSLTCFDTERKWIDKVNRRLAKAPKKCDPEFILIPKKGDQELPKIKCDIMFNDGLIALRVEFLKQIILNDRLKSLGWECKTSFFDGMAKSYKWFINNEEKFP